MEILKFGMQHCSACDTAEKMLKAAGLDFKFIDCESDEGVEWVEELHIRNVPVILIQHDDGSRTILLSISELKEWLHKNSYVS